MTEEEEGEEGPDDLDLMIEESERRSPGFRRRLRREIGRQSIRGRTARQRHLNWTRLIQRWRQEDRELARKVAYMQWRMTHIYSRYAAPQETP